MIPSSKKMGRYECQLLEVLTSYFRTRGFKVYPHVQLNISWGNIISDVDLIAISDDILIGVEVKSKKDKFRRAFQQVNKIRAFFDKVYIASDKSKEFLEKNWEDKTIGLLSIEKGEVTEREGETLLAKLSHSTLEMLRKICLLRLAKVAKCYSIGNKSELAFSISKSMKNEHLRVILKRIVTCERTCETICPIWEFENRLISPLRNIQRVFKKFGQPEDIPLPLIPAEPPEEEINQK